MAAISTSLPKSFGAGSAPAFLSRILAPLIAARQAKADRQVAAVLARRGGVFGEAGSGRDETRAYPFHRLPALRSR